MMCQGGRLQEVKNETNCQNFTSKSGHGRLREVALTRGSKYSDLTRKRLVFWNTRRRAEVIVYERRSQLGFDCIFFVSSLFRLTFGPGERSL